MIDENDTYVLIRIEGSMSDDYLREIRNAFETAISLEKNIVIDLQEVSFISSSGLGLLFNSNSRLKRKDQILVVAGAKDEIRRLFAVTHIENHIIQTESVEEAVRTAG